MRSFVLVTLSLFFVGSDAVLAETPIGGNMHAVVNQDGTLEYFLTTKPGVSISSEDNIPKIDIAKYLASGNQSPKAFKILTSKDVAAGYLVTPNKPKGFDPVMMAVENGYEVKMVGYDSLPKDFSSAFKLKNEQGETKGAWLPTDSTEGYSALTEVLPVSWSTSKVSTTPKLTMAMSKNIPIPEEDFIKSLRESMITQAASLACESKIIPKEIAVTASLVASVGFIVGGEGSISFEATWETAQLCKP